MVMMIDGAEGESLDDGVGGERWRSAWGADAVQLSAGADEL
jgi:hypothetical protein